MKILPTLASVSALVIASVPLHAQVEGGDHPGPEEIVVPVADEDLEATVEAGEQPLLDDEELKQLEFERYRNLIMDGSLDEADASAKRMIEIIIRTDGPKSPDMAKALTNLAIVQHQSENYEAAQQNFESAIEIIEDNEDRLNAQLVNPLKGLAASQLGSGRPDLASTTYGRAVHLTHVNEGPHNLEQIDLLENMAEVQLQVGNLDGARDAQEAIYALNVRAYQNNSLDLVPALMRRAAWQHRAGLILDEQSTYRRVIRILQEKHGKGDLSLVKPHILLGRSYFTRDRSGDEYYLSRTIASGESQFKQALRIAREHPDAPWSVVADATLALGDFYMYTGSPQRARGSYADAWVLMSEPGDEEAKVEKRRNELERNVPLRIQPIRNFIGDANPAQEQRTDNPVYKGTVSFSHGVSRRGRAINLKLVEAHPPEFIEMQAAVRSEIRRRVYRPIFRDGKPAETANQVFVHSYWYRQSDLDALRTPAPAQTAETDDDST